MANAGERDAPQRVDRIGFRALLVWGVATLFVIYQFSLQMTIGVFAEELVAGLETTAAGVGVVTALFALVYALMQVPAGLLVDRGSPRRLMSLGMGTCALAAAVFSMATDIFVAGAARIAMGLGASFGFVGTAVLVARWIPARHFALFIGLTEAAGMLGTGVSDEVVGFFLELFDWRTILRVVALYGAVVGLLIFLFVRDRPMSVAESAVGGSRSASSELGRVLRSGAMGRICAYYALALGAVLGFAGLWNVPFERAFGIPLSNAAQANSLIFIGMAVGCPLAGWLSDRLGRRKPVVLASAAFHFIVLATILYTPLLPSGTVLALRILLGFAAAGNVLAFAMAAEHAPPALRGTAIGAVNMAGFLGVSAAQLVPSALLGNQTDPSVAEYVTVLSTLLVGLLISAVLIAGVAEGRGEASDPSEVGGPH